MTKTVEAVFISDLHLAPECPEITYRFNLFVEWAANNAKQVFILGDFFHAWCGDDALDAWSAAIAKQLAHLVACGCKVYFMPGNRDFLLGQRFAELAQLTMLPDPWILNLENESVLLTHGDRYCTKDKGHQRFRRLTRNWLFKTCFLKLPFRWRWKLVNRVRNYSQNNQNKTPNEMDIVLKDLFSDLDRVGLTKVIHGHIHQPGLREHFHHTKYYQQYVLSDWDASPQLLCYYKTKSFEFILL